MNELIRPQRVFLDSGHLINLLDLRLGEPFRGKQSAERVRAYQRLDESLRTGLCTAVYYEPSAYEWIHDNSLQRALQIAAILDSALSVKRILPDPVIFTVEAMQECQRVEPRIPFPHTRIVDDISAGHALGAWYRQILPHEGEKPGVILAPVDSTRSSPAVASVVRNLFSVIQADPNLWKTAVDGEEYSLGRTRDTQAQHGSSGPVPERFKRHWLRSSLGLDQIITRIAPDIDADAVLDSIDLAACPALQLKLDAYWNYAKANKHTKDHDMIDLTMFAVIPYVDLALIENRMQEFVLQANRSGYQNRCFRDPIDFVAALGRVSDTGAP